MSQLHPLGVFGASLQYIAPRLEIKTPAPQTGASINDKAVGVLNWGDLSGKLFSGNTLRPSPWRRL